MFDEQWVLDGPPDDAALTRAPARRGVLGMLADDDHPICLLTAADMRSRLRNRLREPAQDERSRRADLRAVTRKVVWKRTFSHFETDLRYLELARALWPRKYTAQVSWRPAWFVHVDAEAPVPRFARTREPQSPPGRAFGPFLNARSADRFIDAAQDAFDLCRRYECLRQAPHGRPCTYAQIGRCRSPCDGTISMEDYRRLVARAVDFVAGSRHELVDDLTSRMRQAAEALEFERAEACKERLGRLREFDRPDYAHVAALGSFRYVIVQPGGSVRKAMVFLIDLGEVVHCGAVDYPPVETQLAKALKAMPSRCAPQERLGQAERLVMGLVSRYLFSGPERRGLILRWGADMTPAGLAEEIESAAEILNLRRPRRKKAAKPAP